MDLILVDTSARRRSRHTCPEANPWRQRMGLRQARSGKLAGCLICHSPPWLHQLDRRRSFPSVWLLRACRSLSIFPVGVLAIGRVLTDLSSSTLPLLEVLQILPWDHNRVRTSEGQDISPDRTCLTKSQGISGGSLIRVETLV